MDFSEKLKELRNSKNITQEQLAKSIFVSRSLIARYENGTVIPTKENAEKIAVFFGVDLKELIDVNQTVQMSLKNVKTLNAFNLSINIINIIISSFFTIMSPIPFVETWKYIYPIPPGQSSPERYYYYSSILNATMTNNNPIVLITIIMCIATIILVVFVFISKNRVKIVLQFISHCFFVLILFLILFSLIFGISYLT